MILLDYKDPRPIYEQVVEKLKDLMVCGVWEQDTQLPSVRILAAELSINPNTIQRAYGELERQGFIYSVKGKGSFVADLGSVRSLKRAELKKELEKWVQKSMRACIDQEAVHRWIKSLWSGQKPGEEEEAQ